MEKNDYHYVDELCSFSKDLFIERTDARDAEYEISFCERDNLEGKRIPTMSSSRKYIR